MEHKNNKVKGGKTDYETVLQYAIIGILAALIIYNGVKLYGASPSVTAGTSSGQTLGSQSEYSYVIPTGIPDIYGKELGVSYDDVSTSNPSLADATIAKLTAYEDMQLDNATMIRYIRIGSSIACEYCCGATTLVFSNGERACGCAHSYAMRGLAKYLLTNHPDMTDLEILSELGKWKVLFFPGVHEKKASVLKANGVDETDYINLASNLYRGAEDQATSSGSTSQMVGGC